jgi:hypothetical protein
LAGLVVGVFDLAWDLGFAHDEGIERGGDLEEVLDDLGVVVDVEVGEQVGGVEVGAVGEEFGQVIGIGVFSSGYGGVEFGAVAGGEEDELAGGPGGAEGGEDVGCSGGIEGEPLSQVERGGFVVESEEQEVHGAGSCCRVRRKETGMAAGVWHTCAAGRPARWRIGC